TALALAGADDLDAGRLEAVQGPFHLVILLAPLPAPAEFQDLRRGWSVNPCRQARPAPLLVGGAEPAHFLGQIGHHVQEDVVVVSVGDAHLGPALHGDDAVLELIADDALPL